MSDADALRAALQKIAAYQIVVLKRGNEELVAVGHIRYLREIARKALGLPLLDSGKS